MYIFVPVYSPDTDTIYNFPFGRYSHTDDKTEGCNASVYETLNLREYYSKVREICGKIMDYDSADEYKRLYFLLDGTPTLSFIQLHWNSDVNNVRITLHPDGVPISPFGMLTVLPRTDYFNNTRSLTFSIGIRKIDKNDNKSVGDSLYVYQEYNGGPTSTPSIACQAFYYDKYSGYVNLINIGGITAITKTVIEEPGYTNRTASGGAYAFNVDDMSDPIIQGGTSGPGGGQGDFNNESETIPIPGLPALSAVDTGFISLYNPSLAQLRALASFMWSTDLIDNIRKAFSDPMDAILGLSIVPVAVPDGIQQNVRIGNVTSDIVMTTAASQYVSVDCGTLNIHEYWGSALDYAPNTKAQLILPYIGAREIDVDEVMGKSVNIVYHIDILSGACVCFVAANGSVIYQFEGSCSNQIPITGSNWTQVLTTAVQVAGNAAAFVATAGGSGAVQASTALSGLANTAGNVMNSKPRIEHSGNVTGGGGQMSVQVPYLIVQRPRQSLPINYNVYEGYPSNITAKLADLRGFTSIESIHLEGVNATDQELEEIQQLLRGGVII